MSQAHSHRGVHSNPGNDGKALAACVQPLPDQLPRLPPQVILRPRLSPRPRPRPGPSYGPSAPTRIEGRPSENSKSEVVNLESGNFLVFGPKRLSHLILWIDRIQNLSGVISRPCATLFVGPREPVENHHTKGTADE